MFCLLAALGLFLVSNRRYSGEILLWLHNKYRAASVRIGVLFKLDSPFRLDCACVCVRERAMLNMITDGNGVCVHVCLNMMCVYVRIWAGRTGGLQGEITAQICPLLFTHTLLLRPLKAYPKAYPAHTHTHSPHTEAQTLDPHINPFPNSHSSLHFYLQAP